MATHLTEQDNVVIRIALEELISKYDGLIAVSSNVTTGEVTKGAFIMARAITDGVLAKFITR